ncbi:MULTISPECIES: hypothetical protein [Bacillus]|uniref:hypothetical protein n=1 Tax=Bacillus TaxID=1386 RepID=UPI001CDD7764|nr:hypothetical protein [Bacillus sp. TSO22]
MDDNEEIVRVLGVCIMFLGVLSLGGLELGNNYLFGISVCACFLTFSDLMDTEKPKQKKLKIILYFMGIFAIIVMPHLPIDTINDLGAYTNFYSLLGLGAVIAFLPQKIKEGKLKDKRIKELETEIAEMKKSNLKSE